MSAESRIALAQRKARLLERIDVQRGQLAAYGAQLETPLAWADKALHAIQFVKERPWIAGVGVLMAVLLGRRNLFRWIGRGWSLWRALRFAREWLNSPGIKKLNRNK